MKLLNATLKCSLFVVTILPLVVRCSVNKLLLVVIDGLKSDYLNNDSSMLMPNLEGM